MDFSGYRQWMIDLFFRYVSMDTQSSEESGSFPSTEKQKVFAEKLAADLRQMGLQEVSVDEHGYVMATLPGTAGPEVPVIGFIAHMDTSPDVSGKDVHPVLHENYDGRDIHLAGPPETVIRVDENPDLAGKVGETIVTSDGRTLLGADNKAGIVEILTAIRYLMDHPEIPRGKIRLAFTPDEEVGRGTEHFDISKFGARYAYTVDGETAGQIDNETFCADTVTLVFRGINVHPGYAKGKMVNAIKVAAEFLNRLPQESLSPETTEGREGYVHPNSVTGSVEETTIKLLIRDFEVEGLKEKEEFLRRIAEEAVAKFPGASFDLAVQESYRNMRYKLEEDPRVVEFAMEAVRRAGLEPQLNAIRGGTDGARLSYAGLLTPNIFTGGHNFHSRQEWISVEDMLKAAEVIVHLAQIWAEKSRR
jgi:tripeptide aminopeptidase